MERKFKHKKTGEIAYYKDGIFKQGNCCVEIGVEPSSKFWEETEKYPIGTKVTDTFTEHTYEKTESGKWKLGTQDYFNITDSSIGEGKRFRLLKKEPLFITYDGVELFGSEKVHFVEGFEVFSGVFIPINRNITNKIFAEKTKAEEYIRLNEPKYSLNSILTILNIYADEVPLSYIKSVIKNL